jgi:hypothetical protein
VVKEGVPTEQKELPFMLFVYNLKRALECVEVCDSGSTEVFVMLRHKLLCYLTIVSQLYGLYSAEF